MSIASVERLVGMPAKTAQIPVPRKELSGLRKAAVFLAQLSKEEAGAVLAQLRPSEVEKLTGELMRLENVDGSDVDDVLSEFHTLMNARRFVGTGGVEFAREVLAAGLGEERADGILSRLNVVYTELPFASLRNSDVRQLVTFLKDEHPQVVALVLAHLPAPQSAEVLSGFPPDQQADVAYRIALMDRTAPEMVRMVEEELGRRMGSPLPYPDTAPAGGWARCWPPRTWPRSAAWRRWSRSSTAPPGPPSARSWSGWRAATPSSPRRSARRCSSSRTSSRSTTGPCSWCSATSRPTTWPPRSRASARTSGTRWSATSPSAPGRTCSRRSSCSGRCGPGPSRRPRPRSSPSSARSRSRAR